MKSRRELLENWAARVAKKNKKGLIPVMLLPLAACGGGNGDGVISAFSVSEDPTMAGKGIVTPLNGGTVTLTQDPVNTYKFTPSAGNPVSVTAASVGELSVATGTLSGIQFGPP